MIGLTPKTCLFGGIGGLKIIRIVGYVISMFWRIGSIYYLPISLVLGSGIISRFSGEIIPLRRV
jgi:hypothetical protein